jgi:hypothetical protein
MKRFLAVVAAMTAAAAALIGVLAASATAQSSDSPRTIHFTLVRAPGGFFPPGPPQPGDRFGSLQIVSGDDGSNGKADVLCTFMTTHTRFCNVQFKLSTGTLAFQGIAYDRNKNAPFTVTGGTGAYAVARGSAAVNDVNETTVSFTVKLPG